jgi:formylmethanofuran dehydrogenase subunit B
LVISALRAILSGNPDVVPDKVGNVAKEQLLKIIDIFNSAKFGAIFFGMGLTQSESGIRILTMLFRWSQN